MQKLQKLPNSATSGFESARRNPLGWVFQNEFFQINYNINLINDIFCVSVQSDNIISLQTQIYKIINNFNNNISIETILIENSSYNYYMLKFIKSKYRLFFEIWFNTLSHFINILEYDIKTFIDTHAAYTDFNIQFAEYVANYIYKNLVITQMDDSISLGSNLSVYNSENDEIPQNDVNIVLEEELLKKRVRTMCR